MFMRQQRENKKPLFNWYIIMLYKEVNGTSYSEDTPDSVINALENARKYGNRIKINYGDSKTGLSWLEENDIMGTVGRSTGNIKIPILLANSRSIGGGAILDSSIIKITLGRTILYQHPAFHLPDIQFAPSDMPEYETMALVNGKIHARFKTKKQAEMWLKRVS